MTIVQKVNGTSARLSAERMAMPVMIPGRASGSTRKTEMPSRPKKWNRPTAAAAIEPSTNATSVATSATRTDRRMASHSSRGVEGLAEPVGGETGGREAERALLGREGVEDHDEQREVQEQHHPHHDALEAPARLPALAHSDSKAPKRRATTR